MRSSPKVWSSSNLQMVIPVKNDLYESLVKEKDPQ